MSISLLKLALNALGSPTSVAILGSVGAHALLGVSLPALSVFSPGQRGPSEVPIVELTAEELARLPDLEPAPAIPFVPPAATQLLPLPDNFELPSVAQNPPPKASIPALPPKPSANSSGKTSSLSAPQRIVTRRTRGRTPGISSTRVAAGRRSATSVEDFMRGNRRRVAPGENTPFQVDPNKKPEDTLNESLRESLEPKQTPINPHSDEIAQLEFEEPTKTPAENTVDGTESELDPAAPNGKPVRPTPEGQTEESSGTRDRDSSETENERTSTPTDRQPEATSEDSPRADEENEPAPSEGRDRSQPPARQTPPPRPQLETQPDNPARFEPPQTQENSRENPASESQTQGSPRANPAPEPQRQQRQETQTSPQTPEERETREEEDEEDEQNSELQKEKDTSKASETDRAASDAGE